MSRKLNVFFIHAQWLKDRERVISEFNKLTGKYMFKNIKSIKTRVITDMDPNEINSQIVSSTVNYSHIQDEAGDETKEKKLSNYNSLIKNLHIFHLSNALKHYKALEEIINNTNDNDINIILEDDILYEDKMCILLERLLQQLPSEYDMIFLGLPGTNMEEAKKKNEVRYQNTTETFRILPYCDSYIITKKAAKVLFESYLPIKFCSNIQLSYLIEKNNMKVLTALPNIFMDGSKFGLFLSVLNASNQLIFNNDYMITRNILNKDVLTDEDDKNLSKVFNESMIRNHPDMMHLKSLYLIKKNKLSEAETIFDEALKIYKGNNCILNHESEFLKDYIRLYKNMQTI